MVDGYSGRAPLRDFIDVALAMAAWGLLLFKRWTRRNWASGRTEEWLCPIALLYCQAIAVTGYASDATFVAVVFYLVCVGIATLGLVRG